MLLEIALLYLVQQLAQHYSTNDYVNIDSTGDGEDENPANNDQTGKDGDRGHASDSSKQQGGGESHSDYVVSESSTSPGSTTSRRSTTSSRFSSLAAATESRDDNDDVDDSNNTESKTMYVPFHDSNSSEEWNQWREEVSSKFSKDSKHMFDFQATFDRAKEQLEKNTETMSRVWFDLQLRGQQVEQQAIKNGTEIWSNLWNNANCNNKQLPTRNSTTATARSPPPCHDGYSLSSSPTNSSNNLLLQSTRG